MGDLRTHETERLGVKVGPQVVPDLCARTSVTSKLSSERNESTLWHDYSSKFY